MLLGQQDSPAFRVLLPEWIRGRGVRHTGLLHVIPGTWHKQGPALDGHFTVADQLKVGVQIENKATTIRVVLTVINIGPSEIADIWGNVCAGVNHLPGEPGWSNGRFIPGLPLDRAAQGRYWFDVLTPGRLAAFTGRSWIAMHPCPDHPAASQAPASSFTPSPTADVCACAVESPDGGLWFFQQWNTPCRWCTPCPGNACMHLDPFLAERLPAGAMSGIRGQIDLHAGDRSSLEKMLRRFE